MQLAEIAKADYPMLEPDKIIIDGLIGRQEEDWEEKIYSVSFVLSGVDPKEDYKPISDLFPLGYKFFN